ncbi:eosinophil peroxidase-like [Elgaria multicarinata webbii]|uniref:eosinophil peroxidase-like n=1 Tax=Elgaria multicarinata webbii TaxID=159646 RepID=UPI002FCD3058
MGQKGMRVLTLVAFLVAVTPLRARDPSLRWKPKQNDRLHVIAAARKLGTSALLRSVEKAKQQVNDAYERAQESLREKLRTNKVTPADLMMLFKQPVGQTLEVVKAADYLHTAYDLLKEKLRSASTEDFNITDVLSRVQLQTIYRATGCERQEMRTVVCDEQSPYRTITGECNNRRIITLGSSNRPYARWLLQEYEDGVSLPRGWTETKRYNGFPLPSVRLVSNEIVRYPNQIRLQQQPQQPPPIQPITDDSSRSVFFMQWGQFIDHDMDFGPSVTPLCGSECAKTPSCFPIKLPPNDPKLEQGCCIPFTRLAPACNGGYAIRNQIDALTPFIDASQVYASEVDWALQLRNLSNDLGLLAVNNRTTDRGLALLPFGTPKGFPDNCHLSNPAKNVGCFNAGDNRVNEMPGLIALQTLFMREHNRLATELKRMNPQWNGTVLYQEARKIVGAEIQIITFNEHLPLLLGNTFSRNSQRAPNRYRGYNESVDPRIASVFTIAFRFGHTSVRPSVFRLDAQYRVMNESRLEDEFLATWRIVQSGIDPVLRGLMARPAKLLKQNQIAVDAIRNDLFRVLVKVGLDLLSLNMQRGRDIGLSGYNAWRQFAGLSQPKNEAELAAVLRNPSLAKKFIELYGTPDNIDLWIGGVAEPLVTNGRVGPLLASIIGKQFQNIRDGDRFWWENPGVFTPAQRKALTQVSLPRIICDNTNIREVPRFIFRANQYPRDFVNCNTIPRLSLFPWKAKCESSGLVPADLPHTCALIRRKTKTAQWRRSHSGLQRTLF